MRYAGTTAVALGLVALAGAVHAQSAPAANPLATARPVGFVQLWYADEAAKPGEFSTHRLRVGLAGTSGEDIGYTVIVGAVEPPDKAPHLVDAYLDYRAAPGHTVRMGQFLVPLGLEGPEAIWRNPAIERSTVTRKVNTYALLRDSGVQAMGREGRLGYAVAVLNGAGANAGETDNRKDVVGRLSYRPGANTTVGISAGRGSYLAGGVSRDRDRYGADLEYRRRNAVVRGEFLGREDEQAVGHLTTDGWYALAALRQGPHWEPVVRYERYDPNADAGGDTMVITTLGVNYHAVANTRFSINYENRHAGDDAVTAQMQKVF